MDPSSVGGNHDRLGRRQQSKCRSFCSSRSGASMGSGRMGEADVREGICLEGLSLPRNSQLQVRSDQGSNRGPSAVPDKCARARTEQPTIRCRITKIGTARPRTKQAKRVSAGWSEGSTVRQRPEEPREQRRGSTGAIAKRPAAGATEPASGATGQGGARRRWWFKREARFADTQDRSPRSHEPGQTAEQKFENQCAFS